MIKAMTPNVCNPNPKAFGNVRAQVGGGTQDNPGSTDVVEKLVLNEVTLDERYAGSVVKSGGRRSNFNSPRVMLKKPNYDYAHTSIIFFNLE